MVIRWKMSRPLSLLTAAFAGQGEPAFGDEGKPFRTLRIAIVPVAAFALEEFRVLLQFVAIKFHSETVARGNCDFATRIFKLATLDDVVGKVVIVGVTGETQIGQSSAEM